jgi:hypothetical protein
VLALRDRLVNDVALPLRRCVLDIDLTSRGGWPIYEARPIGAEADRRGL